MTQDFLFFLAIILIIFSVWVGAGGPNNQISFQGPFLSPISGPASSTPVTGTSTSFWNWGGGGGAISADASPYRGRVMLSRDTTGAIQDNPRNEYVVIQTAYGGSEAISLAGWKLSSNVTKESAVLPEASALPKSGRVNTTASVSLTPGEQAIVVTGRSPIGSSFKENLCTGYFEEHQDFAPSLSLSCPTPSQEFTRAYNDDDEEKCLAQVRMMTQCTTETRGSGSVSNTCEKFIEEELSYDGCVAAHKDTANFSRGTWRLFLNKTDDLWKRDKDTIVLLDAEGKLVDSLSY